MGRRSRRRRGDNRLTIIKSTKLTNKTHIKTNSTFEKDNKMERQSIFILLVCALCMCASVVSAKDPVTISVSGTGSVTIPPEYVSVSVGVETRANCIRSATGQ